MKWLIFLFIPLFSFSQSYKDVMSINSLDMFKKVAIENGYELGGIKEDIVTYGFNIVKDSIDGNKSSKWATYDTVDGYWHFDPTPYSAEMSN